MKKNVLTIKDILKRKDYFKNKNNETKELYIKELDANIVVQVPDKELCYEAINMDSENGEDNAFLTYNCVIEPNLKSSELQDEFKPHVPSDIVYDIFKVGTVEYIAKECLKAAGFDGDNVTVVEEMKNDLKN